MADTVRDCSYQYKRCETSPIYVITYLHLLSYCSIDLILIARRGFFKERQTPR